MSGCQLPTLPNPNEPISGVNRPPKALLADLRSAYGMLSVRRMKGELNQEAMRRYMRKFAAELVEEIDLTAIKANEAWEYAEVFRTAERWDLAEKAYRMSLMKKRSEDRRINDSLHLAQTLAMQDRVAEAISTAESVFDAKPNDSAPILPAVLLEIVPAARGKKHDPELAELLRRAIDIHLATVVDPKSEGGKAFLLAQPHHIQDAWSAIAQLFWRNNLITEAKAAEAEGAKMMAERFAKV
ncbi:MAG: hypothetical protein HONBIEJF_01229 [Fimbriimonadaceae bacterium]|nr:hypothetical protein [Fimbriimonadaceae bacterium]